KITQPLTVSRSRCHSASLSQSLVSGCLFSRLSLAAVLASPSLTDLVDLDGKVHQLPCSIKYDGPSSVSHYFKPKPTGIEVEGLEVQEAYFRGRKLQGTVIPIPPGYSVLEPELEQGSNPVKPSSIFRLVPSSSLSLSLISQMFIPPSWKSLQYGSSSFGEGEGEGEALQIFVALRPIIGKPHKPHSPLGFKWKKPS
ncbi:uncharacterized protein LOC132190966, partial [Corylus avellana]|uniref:uncharacterized protein LOC132190966 n=1 Tax=Corylus avellana TaxID=13451 RepID=UPI00286AA1BA